MRAAVVDALRDALFELSLRLTRPVSGSCAARCDRLRVSSRWRATSRQTTTPAGPRHSRRRRIGVSDHATGMRSPSPRDEQGLLVTPGFTAREQAGVVRRLDPPSSSGSSGRRRAPLRPAEQLRRPGSPASRSRCDRHAWAVGDREFSTVSSVFAFGAGAQRRTGTEPGELGVDLLDGVVEMPLFLVPGREVMAQALGQRCQRGCRHWSARRAGRCASELGEQPDAAGGAADGAHGMRPEPGSEARLVQPPARSADGDRAPGEA